MSAPGDASTREQASALGLWIVFSRAYTIALRHVEASIAGFGLTPGEFGVLEVLLHKGPLLLGDIQRKILVSSGGVTYLVDRLERKGLVRRRPCESDRRAMYAELTPEGEARIREIFPAHARAIEHALSGLGPEEQNAARALLRRLGRHAAALRMIKG
jgi:MarR family transcriptional regulator, 2-MHQ and catechol-resistance regulon repressor